MPVVFSGSVSLSLTDRYLAFLDLGLCLLGDAHVSIAGIFHLLSISFYPYLSLKDCFIQIYSVVLLNCFHCQLSFYN